MIMMMTNTLFATIIVVFLTAFSTRVSVRSSKIHSGDYTTKDRSVFKPRQTRQLPRAVDLKGRLLSCQSY